MAQQVGSSLYDSVVLIDSGAFIALADRTDRYHADALECLTRISAHRLPIYAPSPVIFETHRKLLHQIGYWAALRFLRSAYDGSVNIVRPVSGDEMSARALVERYESMALTLSDAASMAIMTRLGIGVCFSFDYDFVNAGFLRIPPFHR